MDNRYRAVTLFLAAGLAIAGASAAWANDVSRAATAQAALPDVSLAQGGEGGDFQDVLSGAELRQALQAGGYVIYFRHAQTEQDYADQVSAVMGDCSTQRMLSEYGWQQARTIGTAFEAMAIPVGDVYSSEYCRAWQTADLAFGRHAKDPALNFEPAEAFTEAQVATMRENVMPFLTTPPAAGTNTVIVGHDDVFDAATGIYPEPQGVAYILKPDGRGGFDLVANLRPEEWATMAQ
jgi:phosphohistidine phosphatase SixA